MIFSKKCARMGNKTAADFAEDAIVANSACFFEMKGDRIADFKNLCFHCSGVFGGLFLFHIANIETIF